VDDASDAELVQCIARADSRQPAAEVVLCRRFAPRVRLYGMKHLRDEDRARDLVQAVLVALLVAARSGRIEDASRVDRFVLGTCRNAVARMRQQTARVPLASEAAVDALATAPAEPLDLDALFACMAKLDARAQRVLMLAFIEERSASEIASALSMTAGNVRVTRHRALAALRECLDDCESPPSEVQP
jgi:RNA polymerase sigma-70 factor (ECF subfamily)